jgi:hypothetical protein
VAEGVGIITCLNLWFQVDVWEAVVGVWRVGNDSENRTAARAKSLMQEKNQERTRVRFCCLRPF